MESSWDQLSPNERYQQLSAARTSVVQTIGALVVVLGGAAALRQANLARLQFRDSQRSQRISSYQEAIRMIGSDSTSEQFAGVQSLKLLSEVDRNFSPLVLRVLSAFIRNNAPTRNPREVIEEAIITVAALASSPEFEEGRVDLRNSDLSHVSLVEAKLRNLNFDGSDFRHANLSGARTANSTFRDCSHDFVNDSGVEPRIEW